MKNKYASFLAFQKDFVKSNNKILNKLADEMPDLSKEAVAIIKKRTRAGYGVNANYGGKERLDALSPRYKKQRKKNKSDLSSEARWNKSNLTKTGSMLDSLYAVVKKLTFRVTVRGEDRDNVSNREKAWWLEEGGRPFLYLSKIEIKRLTKELQKKLEKIIDKLF